ncbi:hypothetical protein [Synechococcus sp. CCY 9618]|uniref:hypothetical protein n=1 Tax=Synechococcus sp. CCY 9618 TaxID=2815602 RepID=UPI001C22F640|nr:hypothetical protein [Synechococcus sp. CCY 9618]
MSARLRLSLPKPVTILSFLVLALSAALVWQGWSALQVDSIGDDAGQNLRSAMNLWQHGIYGESADAVRAGYRREPFPNWILAAHLKWLAGVPAGIRFQELVADPQLLKRSMAVNLFYLIGLFLALWGLCIRLISPRWVAHLVAMVVIYFSYNAFAVDELGSLNTELPAAFLIVLTSLGLLLLRQKCRIRWAILAGLIFGCLVLTKASGAYFAVFLLPALPLFLNRCRGRSVALGLCVALGFALAVLPWMGRNLVEFGKPAIAKGGGVVLLIRSVYDEMTPHEYAGSFYSFAPKPLRKAIFEPYLGFSQTQLKCGGSLERLQRDLSCDEEAMAEGRFDNLRSFYQVGKRGLPRMLHQEVARKNIDSSSEDFLEAAALRRIQSMPLKHVLVSVPLSWRGMWSFDNRRTWFGVLINGLAMFSLLAMPFLGIFMRKFDWVLISIVGVGYFLFYGLFTHFITRYSEPLIPLSLVCLSVLLLAILRRLGVYFFDRGVVPS